MATLSKRGAHNVEVYVGHLPISLTEVIDDSDWIDLSFAENYTVRKEVLEILRDAAMTQVSEKVSITRQALKTLLTFLFRILTGHTDSGAKRGFLQHCLPYLILIFLHSRKLKTTILF